MTEELWKEFESGKLGVIICDIGEEEGFLTDCEERGMKWCSGEDLSEYHPFEYHTHDEFPYGILIRFVANGLTWEVVQKNHVNPNISLYIYYNDDNTVYDSIISKPVGECMCSIADSGDRREFPSGAVRDMAEGKGRCDLMPLDVIANIVGGVDQVDYVLLSIDSFIYTGDVTSLYVAIGDFRKVHLTNVDVETMLLELAQHFEAGAKKYGENNWQKGLPARSYIDSAVRHYLKFLRGDTDERHDRAFVWNLVCCIWTCIHKPELNDYRKGETEE